MKAPTDTGPTKTPCEAKGGYPSSRMPRPQHGVPMARDIYNSQREEVIIKNNSSQPLRSFLLSLTFAHHVVARYLHLYIAGPFGRCTCPCSSRYRLRLGRSTARSNIYYDTEPSHVRRHLDLAGRDSSDHCFCVPGRPGHRCCGKGQKSSLRRTAHGSRASSVSRHGLCISVIQCLWCGRDRCPDTVGLFADVPESPGLEQVSAVIASSSSIPY